jgi:hypothetical protein
MIKESKMVYDGVEVEVEMMDSGRVMLALTEENDSYSTMTVYMTPDQVRQLARNLLQTIGE